MWNYFKIININKRYENYVYSFITIYKYSFHINFIEFIIRKFHKMRYLNYDYTYEICVDSVESAIKCRKRIKKKT